MGGRPGWRQRADACVADCRCRGLRSETHQLHSVLRQRRSQPRDPGQPGLAWHQSARLDRSPTSRPARCVPWRFRARSGYRRSTFRRFASRAINLEFETWRSVVAPPGVSAAARQRLEDALETMTRSQAWRDTLERFGWNDRFLKGPEFVRFVDGEEQRLQSVFRRLGTGRTTVPPHLDLIRRSCSPA